MCRSMSEGGRRCPSHCRRTGPARAVVRAQRVADEARAQLALVAAPAWDDDEWDAWEPARRESALRAWSDRLTLAVRGLLRALDRLRTRVENWIDEMEDARWARRDERSRADNLKLARALAGEMHRAEMALAAAEVDLMHSRVMLNVATAHAEADQLVRWLGEVADDLRRDLADEAALSDRERLTDRLRELAPSTGGEWDERGRWRADDTPHQRIVAARERARIAEGAHRRAAARAERKPTAASEEAERAAAADAFRARREAEQLLRRGDQLACEQAVADARTQRDMLRARLAGLR